MPDRNKPGEADAETRRKKLRELLDQPTKATGGAPESGKKPKTMKDAVDAGVDQGSDKPKKKKVVRRYGPEGKTIDELGG